MKYQVIQQRLTKGKLDEGKNVVWEGTRLKEAVGQCRHQLNSALDMIIKHDYFDALDFEVNVEEHKVTLYDEWGDIILFIQYTVKEIKDD